MKSNTAICSVLEDYMRNNGVDLQGLSQATGIDKGILSAIIERNPPQIIAISHVDLITAVMGLPEGVLYILYVDECFITDAPNREWVTPFLQRCAELERYDCMENILQRLGDDLSFMPELFNAAELFYQQGYTLAATLLYKCVVEGEKYQHSERVAISQYRLFKEKLGKDNRINLRVASQFDPYIHRLSVDDQLDALIDLGNVYSELHAWKRLEEITDQSEKLVGDIYKSECETNRYDESNRKTKHPLVVYYGQVYLMKAEVYNNRKDYDQAKEYNNRYADLSWFKGLGEEGKACVDKFSEWSRANAYVFDLKLGKTEVLPEYVSYIENRECEILPGLEIIMTAANQYGMNVDPVLLKFEDSISSSFQLESEVEGYNHQLSMDRYTILFYEVAYYYSRNSQPERANRFLLISLENAVRMNNKSSIILCMKLFEELRDVASREDLHKYKTIVKGVDDDAENDIFFIDS
ncbi:tetratricopeptide (TPR) repeat protein [Paenibacillus sp. DS2015]|uniref:hypothetical protein n=1 Tax=Paenibacillus sp. DS2015 TaxID=3373917 RepID=UPI003D1F1244